MRTRAFPIALGLIIGLQLLCYMADVPAVTATVVSTAIGCAAYVVLRMREASESDG